MTRPRTRHPTQHDRAAPHLMAQRRAPDPDSFAALGARVRALREAKGWTHPDLSRRAGLSDKVVASIERARCRPHLATLRASTAALGADFAALATLAGYRLSVDKVPARPRVRRPRSPFALFAAFGPQLRALREAQGWSIAELARRSGAGYANIERWERGAVRPQVQSVRRITAALGADYDELARLAGYPLESRE